MAEIIDNNYNVEAAEILANEASVIFIYQFFVFSCSLVFSLYNLILILFIEYVYYYY